MTDLSPQWHDHIFSIPEDTLQADAPGHSCAIVWSSSRNCFAVLARTRPAVHLFAADGTLLKSWGNEELADPHGMTLGGEGDQEHLWITDRGTGHVGKYTLDGELLQTLKAPELPVYTEQAFKPTWVAQETPDSDIWVADGYGAGLIHRYQADGSYQQTFDGSEGDLPTFGCPHGIAFRTSENGTELWLADRNPGRIRIYDRDFNLLRTIEDLGDWPCSFAFHGENTAIPCLKTGVKLLSGDEVIADIGPNAFAKSGWQGEKPDDAEDHLEGRFNCPHGACYDGHGNLYVCELVDGGRVVQLKNLS